MRLCKQVRDLQWPDSQATDNELIEFTMYFRWPVVDHERLLCIDFQRNLLHRCCNSNDTTFRLVMSKKQNTVRVLYQGERRFRRLTLRDLLYGFATNTSWCYANIAAEDERKLKQWLGVNGESSNHYLPELEKWVAAAIDREILQERDARGELRDEDVDLCPEELPAGIVEYIRREVLPADKVLLYKKGNVRGRCYACGELVRANSYQRFRQSEHTKCPVCGSVVTAYLETSDRFKVDYVENIASMQLGTDGKTVFFRQWHLVRDTTAKWENIEGQLKEIARYAVRGDKVAKWQMEFKRNAFMNTWREETSSWWRVRDISKTYDGSYYFYLPEDWRETVSGTSLRYAELEEYHNSECRYYSYRNIIRFAMDWVRYPALEKLWKAGYREVAHRKVFGIGQDHRTTVRWRADTVAEAMGISLRWLKLYVPEEWDVEKLKRVQRILGELAKGKIRETDVPIMVKSEISMDTVNLALGHASVQRIIRYLQKATCQEQERIDREREQAKTAGHSYYGRSASDAVKIEYRDYLNDCQNLQLDLDDLAVLFPADLHAAHQRTIEQVKYRADKEKRKAFSKSVEKLEKLCMEKDGLLIRPAHSAKELIDEGKYLHHCVGGYADRMANGVLAIMLIRRVDDPGTPYYTLEWRDKKVIQCRTLRNEDYTRNPQVKSFVDAWVRWVKGGCKQRRKAAKVA